MTDKPMTVDELVELMAAAHYESDSVSEEGDWEIFKRVTENNHWELGEARTAMYAALHVIDAAGLAIVPVELVDPAFTGTWARLPGDLKALLDDGYGLADFYNAAIAAGRIRVKT